MVPSFVWASYPETLHGHGVVVIVEQLCLALGLRFRLGQLTRDFTWRGRHRRAALPGPRSALFVRVLLPLHNRRRLGGAGIAISGAVVVVDVLGIAGISAALDEPMSLQGVLAGEGLLTGATGERLDAQMDPGMPLEVVVAVEALRTLLALVGTLRLGNL